MSNVNHGKLGGSSLRSTLVSSWGQGALLLAMVLCPLILSGCGSGCPTPLCPLVEPATPINADLRYRLNSDDAAVIIASGSSGQTIEKAICERWSPNDPSNGQNWDAAQWAAHLQLLVSAGDQDAYRVRLYTDGPPGCPIHVALPLPQSDAVEIEWTGDFAWTPGEYTLTATCKNLGQTITESNPAGCNKHLPIEPPVTFKIKVYLWKADLGSMDGPSPVLRGEEATYSMDPKFEGFPNEPTTHANWKSAYNDPPTTTTLEWGGVMVAPTQIQCGVSFNIPSECALDGGTTISLGSQSKPVSINARPWNLDPPPSAFESEEEYKPDFPWTCSSTVPRHQGVSWDRATKTTSVFYPNPFVRLPNGKKLRTWSTSYTRMQVDDSGPCEGIWYVKDSILEVNWENLINDWIKPLSPGPPIPSGNAPLNWFYANEACFPVGNYLIAARSHENLGAATAPNGFGTGHYAQLLYGESIKDVLATIEDNVSRTQSYLAKLTNNEIALANERISQISGDHSVVRGNFTALGGVIPWRENSWNGSAWTDDCRCLVSTSNP